MRRLGTLVFWMSLPSGPGRQKRSPTQCIFICRHIFDEKQFLWSPGTGQLTDTQPSRPQGLRQHAVACDIKGRNLPLACS